MKQTKNELLNLYIKLGLSSFKANLHTTRRKVEIHSTFAAAEISFCLNVAHRDIFA